MAQTGERLVRTNPYVPEAPPAEPDDKRVVFLLDAYPEYDARRWVQSMVGWRRKAAEYEAECDGLREELKRIADGIGLTKCVCQKHAANALKDKDGPA